MITLEEHQDTTTGGAPRRWWIPMTAAAAALVAIFVAAVFVAGDEDTAPAAPAPTVAPSTPAGTLDEEAIAAPSTPVDLAEQFIAAFNTRDVEALRDLAVTPEGFLAELTDENGPTQLSWFEAFDWRMEDAECTDTAQAVNCQLVGRNRLTEFTGVEIPAAARIDVVDDGINAVRVTWNFGEYSTAAFEPFVAWVAATHPDDLSRMWTFSGGTSAHVTPASVELFERNLAEYTDPAAPAPLHDAFLRALSDGDTDGMLDMLAPGATIDLLWATDATELSELARLMAAVDWDWQSGSCTLISSDPDQLPALRCFVAPTSAWAEAGIPLPIGNVEFELSNAGIASVTTGNLASRTSAALEPFWEWLRGQYPDDIEPPIIERDGITVPILVEGSASRTALHVAEFTLDVDS